MTVEVTITDSAGQPLGNVEVSIVNYNTGLVTSRYTDGNGFTSQAVAGDAGDFCTFTTNGYTLSQVYYTLTADPLQRLTLIAVPSFKPAPVDPHRWRGAFCIPDALPGIPYGDGKTIWTPAYGCYDDNWRAEIRQAFKARGYTHFPYNCAGLPYHNDYPNLEDDPQRVRRDLKELNAAGILPVVCATNDALQGPIAESFKANGDIIRVCFPMWEMNGPLPTTEQINACVVATRAAAPKALCYIHFTAGHGAGGEPEGAWWQWANSVGVAGLMSQDDHWDDPVTTGRGLEDTANHLHGKVAGWEGLNLDNVDFESQTTVLYRGRTEAEGIAFTEQVLPHCPSIAGWCDSGPRS